MLNYPWHIELEITNKCMLACPMCPHHIMKRKQGFMSFETLEKVITESRGKSRTCYLHMIGEPLLHNELIPFINYVSAAGIRTSISTNAMLLDEKMCNALFSSRLNELTLALDSLEKPVFETLRKGANFERVMGNINRCLAIRRKTKTKTQLELQVIVMKENVEEVPLFKQMYEPQMKGIGKLLIKGYSTFAGYVPDKSPTKTPPRRNTCGKLWNSTAIQWNGDVVICCRDFEGFTKVGNIMESSLSEIWKNDLYQKHRLALKKKDFTKLDFCKEC